MGTAASPGPKEKKTFDRAIAVIGLFIALAGVIVAIWQSAIANGARRDAQEAVRREQQAEEQTKTAQRQLERERAALCRFANSYRAALDDLKNSLSRYQQTSSPESRAALVGSVNALVSLVGNWRQAQQLSADLVDGYVDKLQAAAQSGNVDAIRVNVETLSKIADTQLPLLEQKLESLSSAPQPSPQPSPSGSPSSSEGISANTGINCDCNNTEAPNIGGGATHQCLESERNLKTAAGEGRLKLQTENGKIVSASTPLCDSVTRGPAAWPFEGASAKSPY